MSKTSTRRRPIFYPDDEQRQTVTPIMNHRASARTTNAPKNRITEEDEALLTTLAQPSGPPYDAYDDDYEPPRNTQPPRRRSLAVAPYEPPRRQGRHPFVWIGGTLAALTLGWLVSTNGAAWCETTFRDPGTYGPTHGNVAVGVFGKGDSPDKQTKLVAMNNGGRVQLVKLTGNDPAKTQIITGPDLRAIGFPDPENAEIHMEVKDVDHDGNADLIVTVYASSYDLPFHRYQAQYVLYGDGKGSLKQRQ